MEYTYSLIPPILGCLGPILSLFCLFAPQSNVAQRIVPVYSAPAPVIPILWDVRVVEEN